jgi:integrase
MARPKNKIPSYLPHPASGQARVRVNGRDIYLGPYGSSESKQAYARFIAENFANGEPPSLAIPTGEKLTIAALVVKYTDFTRTYYVKNGVPTDERYAIKAAVGPLVDLYGNTAADEFGPKRLKAVRQEIVARGRMPTHKPKPTDNQKAKKKRKQTEMRKPTGGPLTRKYINYRIASIVRMFKWAVEEELIPVTVYQSLKAVAALQKGRTTGVLESKKVKPVPEEHIPPVLKQLPPQIAAMVQIQDLAGMRSDEVTIMRPCDIDRSSEVWVYKPYTHKTEHHEIDRKILLGPKAQAILAPWLIRDASSFLFNPKEVREASLASHRKKENASQKKGTRRKLRRPVRLFRDHYDDETYCQAVERACTRAGVPKWTPGRLRHNAGTRVRANFGAEAAQLVLGHQNLSTTEIYAEKDMARYKEIVKEIG